MKSGQDLAKRAKHPHQEFPGVPPPGLLTIIPRARMSSESIAHETEWAIDSEVMRARRIIVFVKSN